MYTLALFALAAVALQVTARRPHFEPKRVGGVLAGAPVNNITVSASSVTQCGQATISWTGTSPPVTLSIGSGGFYVGTTPITTLSDLYDDSTTWTVDAAAGTDLIFEVTDAAGTVGYVQNVQVGSSGDSSCLSSAASAAASSAYPSDSATSAPYVVSSGSPSAAVTASSSKKSKSSKSHSASSTSSVFSSISSSAPGTTAVSSGSASAVAAGTTSAASGSSSTGTATLAAAGAGSSTGTASRIVPGGVVAMVVAGLLASLM